MSVRQHKLNNMGKDYIDSGMYTKTNNGPNSISYILNDKKLSTSHPDFIVENNGSFQSFIYQDGMEYRLFDNFSPSIINIYHETVYVKIDTYIISLIWEYDEFDKKLTNPKIVFLDNNFRNVQNQQQLIDEFNDIIKSGSLPLDDPENWFKNVMFKLAY